MITTKGRMVLALTLALGAVGTMLMASMAGATQYGGF
jgi:hypothetical protein